MSFFNIKKDKRLNSLQKNKDETKLKRWAKLSMFQLQWRTDLPKRDSTFFFFSFFSPTDGQSTMYNFSTLTKGGKQSSAARRGTENPPWVLVSEAVRVLQNMWGVGVLLAPSTSVSSSPSTSPSCSCRSTSWTKLYLYKIRKWHWSGLENWNPFLHLLYHNQKRTLERSFIFFTNKNHLQLHRRTNNKSYSTQTDQHGFQSSNFINNKSSTYIKNGKLLKYFTSWKQDSKKRITNRTKKILF